MKFEPANQYLLVMPDGDAKGFNDINAAKAYINRYYESQVNDDRAENDYNDITELGGEEARRNVCTELGVEEGRCEVYNLEDFINKIDKEVVFDYEKEEVISKLVQEHINMNIYKYNLDIVLSDTEIIDMMEPYGEVD